MKTEYEGFSKQDLIDRWDALQKEDHKLCKQQWKIEDEIEIIEKLLEEKK